MFRGCRIRARACGGRRGILRTLMGLATADDESSIRFTVTLMVPAICRNEPMRFTLTRMVRAALANDTMRFTVTRMVRVALANDTMRFTGRNR